MMHNFIKKNQSIHINKQLLIILFLSLISLTALSQEKKSFMEVDSTTYALYLAGSWDELILEGEEALKLDIDYFYLRMRMGYAFYQKTQYRLAIPHYEKALQYNSNDANALIYLLNCYEYSGRFNDALNLSRQINANQLPELYKKYQSEILAVGFIYSFINGQSNDIIKQIQLKNNLNDGIQKVTNYFHNTTVFLSHRMGKSIIINHSLQYLYKNEYALITDGTEYDENNQSLYQWNYNLQARITPFKGFSISPSLNYSYIKIPIDNIVSDYNESSTLYSVIAQQACKKVNLGLSFSMGEVNHIDQNQYGIHFSWFPKANLNMYYTFDGYYQQQKFNNNAISGFINKHLIGLKASNLWWVEVSGLFSEATNFYDVTNGILFNSLEGTRNMLNFKNIFLIKNSNISLITNIGMYTGVSEFISKNNQLQRTNTQTYNNYNIHAGIIWKL